MSGEQVRTASAATDERLAKLEVAGRLRWAVIAVAVLAVALIVVTDLIGPPEAMLAFLIGGPVIFGLTGIHRLFRPRHWAAFALIAGGLLIGSVGVTSAGEGVSNTYQLRAHGGDIGDSSDPRVAADRRQIITGTIFMVGSLIAVASGVRKLKIDSGLDY